MMYLTCFDFVMVEGFSSSSCAGSRWRKSSRNIHPWSDVNTALFLLPSGADDDEGQQRTEKSIMTAESSASDNPRFGDVVSLKNTGNRSTSFFDTTATIDDSSNDKQALEERRKRNVTVAIASVALAVLNYLWQWTHPITPIQLLVSMQQQSTPLTEIGRNHKPTVMDFWAPWYVP
jgi:hypothetical protein